MRGKTSKNYALNKKYALNNEQRLTTSFYGIIIILLITALTNEKCENVQ